MALVAKMQASEVNARGGGRWAPCAEDDPGAQAVSECPGVQSTYGVPPWLNTTGWVRYEPVGQSGEQIKLAAVSAKGEDDPNREWAMASPSGELVMYIQNPAGFGYVQAGQEYRVTIERLRGPRAQTINAGSLSIHDGSGNTVGREQRQ